MGSYGNFKIVNSVKNKEKKTRMILKMLLKKASKKR